MNIDPKLYNRQMDGTSFVARVIVILPFLRKRWKQGFKRRDTQHPAFCGCIDWHSSVHGAYALLMAARLTGQSQLGRGSRCGFHARIVLDGELESLPAREGLDQELPYGYAWFLKLAKEREQGWVKSDLLPLATEIASRLEQWILSLSDECCYPPCPTKGVW